MLQIPSSALFRHDHDWAVFGAEDVRVRLRPVEIGQRNSLRVEVQSGLQAGERVIVHPDDKVAAGRRVKAR